MKLKTKVQNGYLYKCKDQSIFCHFHLLMGMVQSNTKFFPLFLQQWAYIKKVMVITKDSKKVYEAIAIVL